MNDWTLGDPLLSVAPDTRLAIVHLVHAVRTETSGGCCNSHHTAEDDVHVGPCQLATADDLSDCLRGYHDGVSDNLP